MKSVDQTLPKDPAQVTERGGGEMRQIAMDFCYRYMDLTQEEIGKSFGNVDYSTVSQNRKRLKEKMQTDKRLTSAYIEIDRALYHCQK